MNREIKFRVFDKASTFKPMHIVGEDNHDSFWIDNNIFHYRNLQNGEGSGKNGDYILMQYTGLKDNNGKEIYEGDILKSNTEVTIIKTVVFDEDYAMFGMKDYDFDELTLLTKEKIQYLKFEVIGNIYENKELL